MKMYDIRFCENFKLFACGPSRCGKTCFIIDIIQNLDAITISSPNKVIYVYKVWQQKFDELQESGLVNYFIQDQEHIVDLIKQKTNDDSALIIFDDLINSPNLQEISNLFVVDGRHSNLSLIFLSQRMFVNNESFRQISNNCDYLAVFKNPRNSSEVRVLAQQLTPGSLEFIDIYKQATREPFSYLLVNLTQECQEHVKFLSHIFDYDHHVKCYLKDE